LLFQTGRKARNERESMCKRERTEIEKERVRVVKAEEKGNIR